MRKEELKTSIYFFKKAASGVKANDQDLSSNITWQILTQDTIKTNCKAFQTTDAKKCLISISEKGPGTTIMNDIYIYISRSFKTFQKSLDSLQVKRWLISSKKTLYTNCLTS